MPSGKRLRLLTESHEFESMPEKVDAFFFIIFFTVVCKAVGPRESGQTNLRLFQALDSHHNGSIYI